MRKWIVVLLLVVLVGCTTVPPTLTPEATAAFQANRVVKVLDVFRDAAIAANEMAPDKVTENDTRQIVLWHKASVQVIQVSPQGWRPTVLASLYGLTCDERAKVPTPGPATVCIPQLPQPVVDQMRPYISIVVVVLQEVK